MPQSCTPRHAALLGAEPTDPTLLGRTRKRRWQEGGTHSAQRLVSAESELGTLPVSAFWLRSLHTRSGLGPSAVLRRTHSSDAPLRYPRTVPIGGVPLEYSSVTSRAKGPLWEHCNSPAAAPPPLDAPDMHPPTCRAARSRADRSDPPRPHAQMPLARRGHAQSIKIGERGERARHAPIQFIVLEVSAHPKRTWPLGGTTPHPQQRCAPTVPAHRTP